MAEEHGECSGGGRSILVPPAGVLGSGQESSILGVLAKVRNATIGFVTRVSVRPRGITLQSVDGFS